MNKLKWILSSPVAVPAQHDDGDCKSVKPTDAEYATSSWHEEGFFLPNAEFQGWRFGLLQEKLHVSGLLAFVRSPLGIEASLVSDPFARGIERLSVPAEPPSYAGAFRIEIPRPHDSLENVIVGFQNALPLIKNLLNEHATPNT